MLLIFAPCLKYCLKCNFSLFSLPDCSFSLCNVFVKNLVIFPRVSSTLDFASWTHIVSLTMLLHPLYFLHIGGRIERSAQIPICYFMSRVICSWGTGSLVVTGSVQAAATDDHCPHPLFHYKFLNILLLLLSLHLLIGILLDKETPHALLDSGEV